MFACHWWLNNHFFFTCATKDHSPMPISISRSHPSFKSNFPSARAHGVLLFMMAFLTGHLPALLHPRKWTPKESELFGEESLAYKRHSLSTYTECIHSSISPFEVPGVNCSSHYFLFIRVLTSKRLKDPHTIWAIESLAPLQILFAKGAYSLFTQIKITWKKEQRNMFLVS